MQNMQIRGLERPMTATISQRYTKVPSQIDTKLCLHLRDRAEPH
jgi:hypothetical protein